MKLHASETIYWRKNGPRAMSWDFMTLSLRGCNITKFAQEQTFQAEPFSRMFSRIDLIHQWEDLHPVLI